MCGSDILHAQLLPVCLLMQPTQATWWAKRAGQGLASSHATDVTWGPTTTQLLEAGQSYQLPYDSFSLNFKMGLILPALEGSLS